MDVLVQNDTSQPFDAGLFSTKAATGDREATELFDSTNGISLPTAKVPPGQSLKFRIAYGVEPGKEFILAVNPGSGRKQGIYTG